MDTGRLLLLREDRRVRSYSTVMTDHPAWTPTDGRALVRAMRPRGGDHALARTDGRSVDWCCKDAAAVGPEPGVFFLPASAAGDVPELARALGSLGRVARFRNPSLWDAVGTAIIRQVVRAAQAQVQYRALCAAHGTPVRCGTMTGWLFPSPKPCWASATRSSPPWGWRSSAGRCVLPQPPSWSTAAPGRRCPPTPWC